MAPPAKSVLWVDDEAELLESHRIFLREKAIFRIADDTVSAGPIRASSADGANVTGG